MNFKKLPFKVKRLLSIALSMSMVLSLNTPVLATEADAHTGEPVVIQSTEAELPEDIRTDGALAIGEAPAADEGTLPEAGTEEAGLAAVPEAGDGEAAAQNEGIATIEDTDTADTSGDTTNTTPAANGPLSVGGDTYADLDAALDAVKDATNKTITLSDNVTISSGTEVYDLSGVTIQTNGHTFIIPANADITLKNGTFINEEIMATQATPHSIIRVESGATLKITGENAVYKTNGVELLQILGNVTVENGQFSCTQTKNDGLAKNWYDGTTLFIVQGEGANLTMTGGSIEAKDLVDSAKTCGMYGIYVMYGGSVQLGGKDIPGPTIKSMFGAVGMNNTTAPGTLTIDSGTYENYSECTAANDIIYNAVVYLPARGEATINGGTFTAKGSKGETHVISISRPNNDPDKNQTDGCHLTINGGEFKVDGSSAGKVFGLAGMTTNTNNNSLTIMGGTFSDNSYESAKQKDDASVIPDGYKSVPQKDGTYLVREKIPAGSITLDKTNVILDLNADKEEGATITATVGPEDTDFPGVDWSMAEGDEEIISLKATDGVATVTPVKAGTATVTATNKSGKAVSCTVTVVEKSDTGCDEHTYDQLLYIVKQETCETNGVGKFTCSKCDKAEAKYQTIKGGHQYDTGVTQVEMNCGVDGKVLYTCQRATCKADAEGHTKIETIPASGEHKWKETQTAATCTQPAREGTICSVCNKDNGDVKVTAPATGHSYGKPEVITEATCYKTGLQVSTCNQCDASEEGHVKEEVIPITHKPGEPSYKESNCVEYGRVEVICETCKAVITNSRLENDKPKGHKIEVIPAVPATCTEKGKTEGQVCTACDIVIKKQEETGEIDPTNHDWATTPIKDATCTEKGVQKKACRRCDVAPKYEYTEASHNWVEKSIDKPADCVNAGERTLICNRPNCGVTMKETIKALDHDYPKEGTRKTEPTCGKDGVMEFECKRLGCAASTKGHIKTEPIPATGNHNYVEKTVPATCTTPETKGQFCDVCGKVQPGTDIEVITPAPGHQWVLDSTKVPMSCKTNTKGVEVWKCSKCKVTEERTVEVEHTFNPPTYNEPTCSEYGQEVKTCKYCDHVERTRVDIAPPTNEHTYEKVPEKPANCKETGLTAYEKCSGCGAKKTEPTVIPVDADAHVYEGSDAITYIRDSNCGTEPPTQSVVKKTCDKCKKVTYEYGEVEHSLTGVSPSKITKATCEKDGKQTRTCTQCNQAIETVIPAAGHHYDAGQVTTNATCGEKGVMTFTCQTANTSEVDASKCEAKTYTKDIPATGAHNYEEQTLPADCEHGDRKGLICKTCKASKPGSVTETGKPNGHKWTNVKGDDQNWDMDCTENKAGRQNQECSVCHKTQIKVTPVTHNLGEPEYQNATCDEGDMEVRKCKDCHKVIEKTPIGLVGPKHHPEEERVAIPEVPATCKNEGTTAGVKCNWCGEVLTAPETIPVDPNNHTYDEDNYTTVKPANCLTGENGMRYCRCKDCGAYKYDIIQAEHNWDEDKMNADGSAVVHECKVCHIEEIVWVLDDYVFCTSSTCKNTIQDAEMIPGKAATCTESGLADGKKCKVCKAVYQEVIPKKDHKTGEWEVEKEATCTAAGRRIKKCSLCQEVVESEVIQMKEHAAGGWEVQTPASCKDGLEVRKCTQGCGKVMEQRVIPADKAHAYKEGIPADASPTCTESVKTAEICEVCGAVNPDFVGEDMGAFFPEYAALGHDFGGDDVCSRCGLKLMETSGAAITIGGVNKVRFSTKIIAFPEGWVQEEGMLYITSAAYNPANAGSDLTLEGYASGAAKKKSVTQDMEGTALYFDLNMKDTTLDRVLYARGFVTVKEPSGKVTTYYGPVTQGSYNTFNGGN